MLSDVNILQLLRNGTDDKALAALYSHLPGIRRMIRFHGGRREDADDMFQEALIIFCRKAGDPQFRLSSGIYAYLYSVCRLLWSEELRRRGRQPLVDTEAPGIADAGILEMLENERRYRLAESIVDRLADRCRELLQLFYTTPLKLRDIAAKMNYASEQSAKNQKYKCLETAREQFRQALQSENQHIV